MAEKIKNFGGFKVINGSAANFDISVLTDKTVIYFVRTTSGNTKEDGFIYFNGKKYGTGKLSSDNIQNQIKALQSEVDKHINNKATVTAKERDTQDDNGVLSGDTEEKWLTGTAIEKIKTYVDSEDVKHMELVGNEIQLKNATGVVLATLNASKFIKDGMLESVTLVDDETKGKVLQFTWNTDSGKNSTPIEVSDFFHEISGDTNTITVKQPSSGTNGSLQISAITVANVSGVTSDATALMTGGITQQYVAQEIETLKTGLDSKLSLSATTGGVTYATANIAQADGKLSDLNSDLYLNVATGLTTEHAGFVYNSTAHTFTAQASAFNKQGLLNAQEVIDLLHNNNTNVANALTYLKGQITTVTGSDYITVTKEEGSNNYTVSASGTLQTAIGKANSAVQSVNGKSGTSVTINSSDIQLGEAISGHATTNSVTTVLEDIYTKLNTTSSDALKSVSGSTSINVSERQNGSQEISVNAKHLSDTEKAAGQIEIITTGTTGIYGLLYFGGDDVEE